MKLKKFKEYELIYSKDPKNFEQKVSFASSTNNNIPDIFNKINRGYSKLIESSNSPIILWNNFNITESPINENSSYLFNSRSTPDIEEINSEFRGEKFIPVSVKNRSEIKKLKFPIIACDGKSKESFSTYGKFKKSEKYFDNFSEKPIPKTIFSVIAFKNKPIDIQEKINSINFDVDINRFKYFDNILDITKKLNEKYKLDFYNLSIILDESNKIYLDSVSTSTTLNNTQSIKMYEAAYESYYETRLPNWFKKQLFEKYIKPEYTKKYYNSLLIKPKHSINYEKFIK